MLSATTVMKLQAPNNLFLLQLLRLITAIEKYLRCYILSGYIFELFLLFGRYEQCCTEHLHVFVWTYDLIPLGYGAKGRPSRSFGNVCA